MLDRDLPPLPPTVVVGCLGRLVVLDEDADEHDDVVVAVEEDANERCLYAVVLLGPAPF